MSSLSPYKALDIDENDIKKCMPVKENGNGTKPKLLNRTALSDMENRTPPDAGVGKDALQKCLRDAKLPSIRATKLQSATHCKKGLCLALTTRINNDQKTATTFDSTKSTSGVVVGLSPLRLAGMKMANVANASAAGNSRNCQATETTKTMQTTKMVDFELQECNIVNAEKTFLVENGLSTDLNAALFPEVHIVNASIQSTSAVTSGAALEAQEGAETDSQSAESLVKEVCSIDNDVEDSLFFVSDYINDIYEYLFQLEMEKPIRKHHLANQNDITPKMRAIVLDWVNEVHLQLNLVIDTFYMTVDIIDRYLQAVPSTDRTVLQLVAITALFLTSKCEGCYPPSISDFAYVTGNNYSQQEVLEMEISILKQIDYNLSRPVSIHFVRWFAKAGDIDEIEYIMSKYFLELAATEYELASHKPSEIAAASLFLAFHMTKDDPKKASGFNDSHWSATLHLYSRYSPGYLRPITRKIASAARHAPKSKLKTAYKKYQYSVFFKVSLRPALYSTLMDSIIDGDD